MFLRNELTFFKKEAVNLSLDEVKDFEVFKQTSLNIIKIKCEEKESQEWVLFCQYLDDSPFTNSEKLLLIRVAFNCLANTITQGEFAQFITLSNHVKSISGQRLLHLLFSNKVKINTIELRHYIIILQLLLELIEMPGMIKIVRDTLPDLIALIEKLEVMKEEMLAKRYPERNLDETILRFSDKSQLAFPLPNNQLHILKEEYLAYKAACEQFKDHSLLALKACIIGSTKTELIAICSEVIRHVYKIKPYDTQILAVLGLLNTPDQFKGRIAQIKTGEGKSTIIAILAAYMALHDGHDYFVNLITSSPNLAIRDSQKFRPFFEALELTVAHISHEKPKKEHFQARILYGTNTDFEFALMFDGLYNMQLLNSLGKNGELQPRSYDVVIVDEVDNLFLDTALNSAQISVPDKVDIRWIYPLILTFISIPFEEIQEMQRQQRQERRAKRREQDNLIFEELIQALKKSDSSSDNEQSIDWSCDFEDDQSESEEIIKKPPYTEITEVKNYSGYISPIKREKKRESNEEVKQSNFFEESFFKNKIPKFSYTSDSEDSLEDEMFERVESLRVFILNQVDKDKQNSLEALDNAYLARLITSAESALYEKNEDQDYSVKFKKEGKSSKKEIVIVDYENTGRHQEGSQWCNGIHQFLQAKHGLKIKPSGKIAASLSHPAYFNLYKIILGLTGTMGELVERKEVEQNYQLQSFDVPPHFPSLRKKDTDHILPSMRQKWEVVYDKISLMHKQGRPSLILFKTIKESVLFSQYLEEKNCKHQLINERQKESEDYLIAQAGDSGMITCATNTAGRGIDIIISPKSLEAGGLLTIFTFYPDNLRVEGQGVGRSGRQGQPGSSCMILNAQEIREIYSDNVNIQCYIPIFLEMQEENNALIDASPLMECMGLVRSQKIQYQSKQRSISSEKEKVYFEKLSNFFNKMKVIYSLMEDVNFEKTLIDICKTGEYEVTGVSNDSCWDPIIEMADLLGENQENANWNALVKKLKEIFIENVRDLWSNYYSKLRDPLENNQVEAAYQSVEPYLVEPQKMMVKILQDILYLSISKETSTRLAL